MRQGSVAVRASLHRVPGRRFVRTLTCSLNFAVGCREHRESDGSGQVLADPRPCDELVLGTSRRQEAQKPLQTSRLALVAAKFADLLDPEFSPVRGQCCDL